MSESLKIKRYPISTEEAIALHSRWKDQAYASLLSAFAELRLKFKSNSEKESFAKCSNNARSAQDLAKCWHIFHEEPLKTRTEWSGTDQRFWSKTKRFHQEQTERKHHFEAKNEADKYRRFHKYGRTVIQNKRRQKRENTIFEVVSRRNYSLSEGSSISGLSPVGGLARLLMSSVLAQKNKSEARPWQLVVEQVKEIRKLKESPRNPYFKPSSSDFTESENRKNRQLDDSSFSNLENNGRQINRPESSAEKIGRMASNLVQDGFRIGMQLSGQNPGDLDKKNLKAISPRFLSLTPEDAQSSNKTLNFLSPSILSLHNRGSGVEEKLSLPTLIGGSISAKKDRDEWLNLVMEVSGVNEQVDFVKEMLGGNRSIIDHVYEKFLKTHKKTGFSKEEIRKKFGEDESRKHETWEKLQSSYTTAQWKEMEETGFSLLKSDQLDIVYGPNSPFNNSKALERISNFVKHKPEGLNVEQLFNENKGILQDIMRIASHGVASLDNIPEKEYPNEKFRKRRRKRVVLLSPVVLNPPVLDPHRTSQPVILSPYVLSPAIVSPSLLGPFILSPRLFIPLIISPRVLGPYILVPYAFSAVILSPLLFQPNVLSPGIFNPNIISPTVFSPNILSPNAYSPFILSPFVFSPTILTPQLSSPTIMSPFVLSPTIMSPRAISGLFLSPYVLSPLIHSPLFKFTVFMSPSFLS